MQWVHGAQQAQTGDQALGIGNLAIQRAGLNLVMGRPGNLASKLEAGNIRQAWQSGIQAWTSQEKLAVDTGLDGHLHPHTSCLHRSHTIRVHHGTTSASEYFVISCVYHTCGHSSTQENRWKSRIQNFVWSHHGLDGRADSPVPGNQAGLASKLEPGNWAGLVIWHSGLNWAIRQAWQSGNPATWQSSPIWTSMAYDISKILSGVPQACWAPEPAMY